MKVLWLSEVVTLIFTVVLKTLWYICEGNSISSVHHHTQSPLNLVNRRFSFKKQHSANTETNQEHRSIHKIVLTVPKIKSTEQTRYALKGSDIFIHCKTDEHISLNIESTTQYFWLNRFGNRLSNERYYSFKNGTLFIHNIQIQDSGWVTCHAKFLSTFSINDEERFHHRIVVYSAPIFGYRLTWEYLTTQCRKETEKEYRDWIYGQLQPAICADLECELTQIEVQCRNLEQRLTVKMLLSTNTEKSTHCNLTCIEIATAAVINVAFENLKTKLKDELQLHLPSTGTIILPATTFHSMFTLSCRTGSEVRQNVCMACEYGTYSTSISTCEPCDRGFFSNISGSGECHKCPFGKTTIHMGATSERQCLGVRWWDYVPRVLLPFTAMLIGVFVGMAITSRRGKAAREFGETEGNTESEVLLSNRKKRQHFSKDIYEGEESDELSSLSDNSESDDTYSGWRIINEPSPRRHDAMELITQREGSSNATPGISIQKADMSESRSGAKEHFVKNEEMRTSNNNVNHLHVSNSRDSLRSEKNAAASSSSSVVLTNVNIAHNVPDSKNEDVAQRQKLVTSSNVSTRAKLTGVTSVPSINDGQLQPSVSPLNKLKERKYQKVLSDVELE